MKRKFRPTGPSMAFVAGLLCISLALCLPAVFILGSQINRAVTQEVAKTPVIPSGAFVRYKVGKLSPDEDAIVTSIPLDTYPISGKENLLAAIDRAEKELKARRVLPPDHALWFNSLRRAVQKDLPIEIHVTQLSVMEFYCLSNGKKILAANPFYEDGDYYTLAELYGTSDFYEKAIAPNDVCF